jgi:hypothetical protein
LLASDGTRTSRDEGLGTHRREALPPVGHRCRRIVLRLVLVAEDTTSWQGSGANLRNPRAMDPQTAQPTWLGTPIARQTLLQRPVLTTPSHKPVLCLWRRIGSTKNGAFASVRGPKINRPKASNPGVAAFHQNFDAESRGRGRCTGLRRESDRRVPVIPLTGNICRTWPCP